MVGNYLKIGTKLENCVRLCYLNFYTGLENMTRNLIREYHDSKLETRRLEILKKHGSMGFHKTPLWKASPYTIIRSSVAKITRNLKMTVFQEMAIESKLLNQM